MATAPRPRKEPDLDVLEIPGHSRCTRYVQHIVLVMAASVALHGCASTKGSTRGEPERTAMLQLLVEPGGAEVFIDEAYYGEVDKWRDGVIALVPGDHQVELRAEGHMSERFDVRMHDGGELVLEVVMEPELGVPSLEEDEPASTPTSPTFPLSRTP